MFDGENPAIVRIAVISFLSALEFDLESLSRVHTDKVTYRAFRRMIEAL